MIPPFLSIAVISPNEAESFQKTLDSVFNQNFSFLVEVVIFCDTAEKYNFEVNSHHSDLTIVKLVSLPRDLSKQNLSFSRIVGQCQGKYVAFITPGDHWINEHKLQIQIDFLEGNQEYAAVFHNTKIIRDINNPYNPQNINEPVAHESELTTKWFIAKRGVHLSSILMRNGNYPDFTLFVNETKLWGQSILLYISIIGKIKFLNKFMAICLDTSIKKDSELFNGIIPYILLFDHFNIYSRGRFKLEIEESLNQMLNSYLMQRGYFSRQEILNNKINLKSGLLIRKYLHNVWNFIKSSIFMLRIWLNRNWLTILRVFEPCKPNKRIAIDDLKYHKSILIESGRTVEIQPEDINTDCAVLSCFFMGKAHPQHGTTMRKPDFDYISDWYNSVKKIGVNAYIFYDELPDEFLSCYQTDKIRFRKCKLGIYSVFEERWMIYYLFILNSKLKKIFITDINDVTINRNPFAGIDFTNKIYVGRDNINRVLHSKWMLNEKRNFENDSGINLPFGFLLMPLYNAGLLGGNKDYLLFILMHINKLTLTTKTDSHKDMTLLNYVLFNFFSPNIEFKKSERSNTDPSDDPQRNAKMIVSGYPFNSAYKFYETNSDAYFIHK